MARKINVKLIMELRDAGLSRSTIASTRHISRHSVSEVFNIADEKGIHYDDIRALDDSEVYRIFYPEKFANETMYGDPDYEHVHQELKKVGVTLKLLHEEYVDRCERNGEIPMGKTKFNEGYAEFTVANRLTNHLEHKPGERAEVDRSGPTMHYVDMSTGELITVYLFVGTLPYSQYSYVEPCLDMKMDTFIRCHIRMYEYFGGAPIRTVCDNLKTGVVSHPKEGEIILTDDYAALGSHYMTAIMPAGVRKAGARVRPHLIPSFLVFPKCSQVHDLINPTYCGNIENKYGYGGGVLMNEQLLKMNGLSLDILDALSFESHLGIPLKKNLHYFDKTLLIQELYEMTEWLDGQELLSEIAIDYRVKSMDSILLKYDRYYPDHQTRKVFNDILGFRAFCDNYDDARSFESEQFRVADMSMGKANDDGYRGVHVYYQKSGRHYPIEIQFNTLFDRQLNNWLHDYLYKKSLPNSVGRTMRNKYESGLIRDDNSFKEVLEDVLSDCERS